jgi:predicted amidohydrolase
VRAAAVQLNSGSERDANLARAERLVRKASEGGAELIVLPEKFNVLGAPEHLRAGAEPIDGPTISWARTLASELGIWLVAGSVAESSPASERLRNTSVLVGPDGATHAVYRKIHMFDVEVGDRSYRESELEAPGDELVLADAGGLGLGMAICYDLRFPELFRILAVRGARAFALPSAFTVPTGSAHWHVLVRARAIENQAFVIAAGQVGAHPGDHHSYGHSMIVDPWGRVLDELADGEGVVAAELDLAEQDRVRRELPSLASRKPATYVWPTIAGAAA